MINEDRVRNYFLDLVRIDSESRKERDIAFKLKADLEALGAEVSIDNADEKVRGNVGNLVAVFPGQQRSAPPILLSAHMDTVSPGQGVRPVVEGTIVRTDGGTILGGDDKSGLAAIMEALRTIKEQGLSTGDIEIVFTICEEKGLLGAKYLDVSPLKSKYGLVLDATEVGTLYVKGPAANHLQWTVHGLEAHAGVSPEKGLSAIKIASEAIAAMRLGRIDEETTANIGVINGGIATNIIPNQVVIHGEARSHDEGKLASQTDHMSKCLEDAAARYVLELDGARYVGRIEPHIERAYDRMNVPEDSTIVKLLKEAASKTGINVILGTTGGGCDANVFNGKGLLIANLGTGMRDIHTVKESIDLRDIATTARLVLEVVLLNSAQSKG